MAHQECQGKIDQELRQRSFARCSFERHPSEINEGEQRLITSGGPHLSLISARSLRQVHLPNVHCPMFRESQSHFDNSRPDKTNLNQNNGSICLDIAFENFHSTGSSFNDDSQGIT